MASESLRADGNRASGSDVLDVHIVGAGLGGLGAAIAIRLAGHAVTVLESASCIGEVGAGIQILPNAARVLRSWGLEDILNEHATKPRKCNFLGWRGNHLGEMDFHGYAAAAGGYQFRDFHRASLHRCMLERAEQLGATIIVGAQVVSFEASTDDLTATLVLADGREIKSDLIVAADGINSTLRDVFVGRPDPPKPTGDLAYRLLLPASELLKDPDLRAFVQDPQVNYWIGPDKHAVNYVLRGGELFNMVLLVPDDMPSGGSDTLEGNMDEMRAHFSDWDPRIPKLLALCKSVLKWRLCIRPGLDPTWSHPSGTFTMLGDAVHATLPYLASGAGMALEDAGVLGLCLEKVTDKCPSARKRALHVYEACRRERTERVVNRGTYNQVMYHLHDGEEQQARDARFAKYDKWDKEWLNQENPVLVGSQETGEDPFPWRYHGVGRWLLTYDLWEDVDRRWSEVLSKEADDWSDPGSNSAAPSVQWCETRN